MGKFLQKYLYKLDIVIILLGVYIFCFKLDYSNLSTMDIVYIVISVVWFIMFLIRRYIEFKNKGGRF